MKYLRTAFVLLAIGFAPSAAQAQQVIGLATTKGGATAQIATALAKVISEKSDLEVRPQEMANTSQYLPLVNSGKVELGIANLPQTYYAVTGTGMSPGQPNPNLRLIARLFPFAAGLVATDKSGLKSYADLKGKRVPRFPADSLGDFFIRACLADAGLTYGDVVSVPMANFPRQFAAFKQGDIDVSIAAVGSQTVIDFKATLGGVHFISFDSRKADAVEKIMPGGELRKMPVSDANVGISTDTLVLAYDYTLFAGASVPDAIIAKVVKALISGATDLKASSPLWAEYDPKKLYRNLTGSAAVLKYHPGATAAYKAAGL